MRKTLTALLTAALLAGWATPAHAAARTCTMTAPRHTTTQTVYNISLNFRPTTGSTYRIRAWYGAGLATPNYAAKTLPIRRAKHTTVYRVVGSVAGVVCRTWNKPHDW